MSKRVDQNSVRFSDPNMPLTIAIRDMETKRDLLIAMDLVTKKVGFTPSIPQIVKFLIKDYVKTYG